MCSLLKGFLWNYKHNVLSKRFLIISTLLTTKQETEEHLPCHLVVIKLIYMGTAGSIPANTHENHFATVHIGMHILQSNTQHAI